MAKRHALLIGISRYGEGLQPIPSALLDVEKMAEVLLDPELGGIEEPHLQVLRDPGRTELASAIESFYADKEVNDLLLLYFSGHGFRDDDRQLLLSSAESKKVQPDGKSRVQRATTLTAAEVRGFMERSRCKRQVVILDCCFSGAFAEGLMAKDEGPMEIEGMLGGKGRAILTSSDAIETSRAPEAGDGLSVYTRFLVEGIQTGAADRQRRGWLDPEDLHLYAKSRVLEVAPSMTPQFFPTREGHSIRVCRVRREPSVAYRQKVQELAESRRGKISPAGREILADLAAELGLTSETAGQIEAEVLQPFRDYAAKLERYLSAAKATLEAGGSQGLSSQDREELKELEQRLKLGAADVATIHHELGIQADAPGASQGRKLAAPANRQEQLDATRRKFYEFNRRLISKKPSEDCGLGSSQIRDISVGDSGGAENPEQQPVKTSHDMDWRSQRLAAIKERLERKDAEHQRTRGGDFGVEPATNPAKADNLPLIQIPASKGWLVREGNQWWKKEAPITVPGFLEELAERIAITMIQIPAGEFLMGSTESERERSESEGTQHHVNLPSFFLGQTPVTQGQWKVVASWPKVKMDLKPDPSEFKEANRPVEQVSWDEAMEFCRRLSQRTKREYNLPSEAQWEYACRASTTTPLAFGETLTPELANYNGNFTYGTGPKGIYREETSAVGSFPANAWGVQDMHGNVREWCLDIWHDSYNGAPIDGTPWGSTGDQGGRLLRGGSWGSGPTFCRSAFREWWHREGRVSLIGFRLCVPLPGCTS
jgi:formylglycine-generating enzyme required for sulfatase activity